VTAEDFRRFDLILCADRCNLAWLHAEGGAAAKDRIALALDWCGVVAGGEMPDPSRHGRRFRTGQPPGARGR
jgi:protein-tyrosine phosphatase